MIFCVLPAPCVYISVHYRNVQGAAGADDFGTAVPSPAVHSPGTDLVPAAW